MSGYNPLAWRPPDDTDNAGMTVNPLATQSAPQPGLSTSDAWTHITNKVGDFLAAQRADAEAKGLWDPETGFPTGNGLLDAIKQYSGAMLAGTTAPGGRGIIAYHGSPHDFDAFDMSKIGTGEGAQAYGHGMYFAGNEGVATTYKQSPAQKTMNGPVNTWVAQAGGDWNKALANFNNFTKDLPQTEAQAQVRTILENGVKPGHMYQVNINAEPGQFLDWDKPLGMQSPEVRQAIGFRGVSTPSIDATTAAMRAAREAGVPFRDFPAYKALQEQLQASKSAAFQDVGLPVDSLRSSPADVRGSEYLGALQDRMGPANASAALAQHGIPGIRYLDAGSRGAGEGTHNYVMFDPKLVTILRKYGLLGTIGGAAAASGGQDQ